MSKIDDLYTKEILISEVRLQSCYKLSVKSQSSWRSLAELINVNGAHLRFNCRLSVLVILLILFYIKT